MLGFIDDVRQNAGLRSPEEAEQVAAAVLRGLGAFLEEGEVQRAVAAKLPAGLEAALLVGAWDPPPADLPHRVADLEGVPLGFGLEHAQGVMRALGHSLDLECLDRLCSALPPEVAQMLDEARA